jgi:hypothetical protein
VQTGAQETLSARGVRAIGHGTYAVERRRGMRAASWASCLHPKRTGEADRTYQHSRSHGGPGAHSELLVTPFLPLDDRGGIVLPSSSVESLDKSAERTFEPV